MLTLGDAPTPFRPRGFLAGLEPQGDDERGADLAGNRPSPLGWAVLLSHPWQYRMAAFQQPSKFGGNPLRGVGQGIGAGAEAARLWALSAVRAVC